MIDVDSNKRVVEFNLSTPYDTSTVTEGNSFAISGTVAAAVLQDFSFDDDGTRMYVIESRINPIATFIYVYKLSTGFDITSATFVGKVQQVFESLGSDGTNGTPLGMGFSEDGMKLYQVTYQDKAIGTRDRVHEYDLICPYGIVICETDPVTAIGAQVEIAKNVIYQNSSTIFKRFEWIKRNRNSNNLNNLNASIKFDNPMLNYWVKKFPDKLVAVNEAVEGGLSITIGREYKKRNKNSNNLDNFNTAIKSDNPLLNSWLNKLPEKITAHLASVEKKTEDKKQDLFFWSEGSIAVGRIGDTSISSTKKIGTDAITVGADKFTSKNGIKGLAFRIGRDNVDVGTAGSNLDTDTYLSLIHI